MALLGGVILVVTVVVWVLIPVLRGQHASLEREADELTDAEARRRTTLLALRDVEYDFHTGKLDAEDYQELRRELSAEALAALEALESDGSAAAHGLDVEAEIAAVRAGLEAGTTCGACGQLNPEGSRFCGSCGGKLPVRPEASPSS